MPLDLRQLSAFLAIVQHGSLGRAAEHLHITQPALSRTVRRLETQLGVPLFERHTTGMRLTPFGEALHPHATLLLRGSEQATEEINALRGVARGTIRVGTMASAASMVLPLAIDNVLTHWPQLQVRILEGVGDVMTTALLNYEIDLAICITLPEYENICPVADCEWTDNSFVIASTHHPLRKKRKLRLEDLLEQRWVMSPRGTSPSDELVALLSQHGLGMPNVVVETRSIIAIKSLIAHAGFLGWMAESMFHAEKKAGLIAPLPIAGATAQRRLSVFRRRQGMLPGPALKLLESLRRVTGVRK
jgi:DNA-binding transcriptional LysR family regulator